jgi:hypothetical protein
MLQIEELCYSSLVVRAKLIVMMSDNLVVDSASFRVLIIKLCTDFESWH